MAFSSGFLDKIITPLNRKAATAGKFGLDSDGIEWTEVGNFHANVDYQRGKCGMSAGSLDVYAVKIVRMRWTDAFGDRSRIKYDGKLYQIIPGTFNVDKQANTLQFLMQLVNDKQTIPEPTSL